MPRLTADQWAAVRLEWEGEPTATFHALAAKHGVDKASISRAAARQGWSKRGVLGDINDAAQRKADARVDADGNAIQRATQPERNAGDLASREESEDVRAAVLERMRKEWAELDGFRKAALRVMKAAHEGTEEWKNAKLAADTALANMRALEVKQSGERKAWGLDTSTEAEIVIGNPRGAVDAS